MNVDELLKTKVGQLAGNRAALEQAKAKLGGAPSHHLASVVPAQLQRHEVPALDEGKKALRRRKRGVVVCVEIIRCGVREFDDDSVPAAYKNLRDAISTSLGVDDADKRIKWQYHQIVGCGETGTIVRISIV